MGEQDFVGRPEALRTKIERGKAKGYLAIPFERMHSGHLTKLEMELEENGQVNTKVEAVYRETHLPFADDVLQAIRLEDGYRRIVDAGRGAADLIAFYKQEGFPPGVTEKGLKLTVGKGEEAEREIATLRGEGKLVSEEAADEFRRWRSWERRTGQSQSVLMGALEENKDSILSGELPEEKLRALDLTAEIIKLKQRATITHLQSLGEETAGFTYNEASIGGQVDSYVQETIEKTDGARPDLSPENTLVDGEHVEGELGEIMTKARVNAEYDKGRHRRILMEKLGVSEENERLIISDESALRAFILAKDTLRATTTAFEKNLEMGGDYALPALCVAYDTIQARAILEATEAVVSEVAQEVFEAQQADIKAEIAGASKAKGKAEKVIKKETRKEQRRLKILSAVNNGLRALRNRLTNPIYERIMKAEEENRARDQRLAELNQLLAEE